MTDSMNETPQIETFKQAHHESFNLLDHPIFVVSLDGIIHDANTEALQKLGITLGHMPDDATNIMSFIPDESDRTAFYKAARFALKKQVKGENDPTPPEFLVRLPNDQTRIMEVHSKFIAPTQDSTESNMKNIRANTGMLLQVFDVTEKHRIQAQEAFSREIVGPKSLNSILEITAKRLQTVVNYDSANLMLFDEEGTLQVHASWDTEHKSLDTAPRIATSHTEQWGTIRSMTESKKPVIISDTATDPHWNKQNASEIGSYLGTPILVNDTIVGFLNINSKKTNALTQESAQDISELSQILASAIENARVQNELTNQSDRDPLTGLYNRRSASEIGEKIIKQRNRRTAILLFDTDDFKGVNDTYGHLTGDDVIQGIAHTLKDISRDSDYEIRYGGDEFAALSPDTNTQQAFRYAQRLRNALQKTYFSQRNNHEVTFRKTLSIGLVSTPIYRGKNETSATGDRQQERNLDFYYQRADTAAYLSKQIGNKNAVSIYYVGEVSESFTRPDYVAVYKNDDNGTSQNMDITLVYADEQAGKAVLDDPLHVPKSYHMEFTQDMVILRDKQTDEVIATIERSTQALSNIDIVGEPYGTSWIFDAIPPSYFRKDQVEYI